MSMLGSIMLFAIFITAYFTIIEAFTIFFRLTGLTPEKAKMQVISMLTNSGFTTNESEMIMSSKKRRKLAQMTMLFGYSFTVIIVSTIVNIFLALSQAELHNLLLGVVILVVTLGLLLVVLRLRAVRMGFDRIIEKLGNRMMFGKGSNTVVLIDTYSAKAMVEIFLQIVPDFLCGTSLAEAGLRPQYDIQVLFIKRGGLSIDEINGETVLRQNDILYLFGDYKNIRAIFEHPDKRDTADDKR